MQRNEVFSKANMLRLGMLSFVLSFFNAVESHHLQEGVMIVFAGANWFAIRLFNTNIGVGYVLYFLPVFIATYLILIALWACTSFAYVFTSGKSGLDHKSEGRVETTLLQFDNFWASLTSTLSKANLSRLLLFSFLFASLDNLESYYLEHVVYPPAKELNGVPAYFYAHGPVGYMAWIPFETIAFCGMLLALWIYTTYFFWVIENYRVQRSRIIELERRNAPQNRKGNPELRSEHGMTQKRNATK